MDSSLISALLSACPYALVLDREANVTAYGNFYLRYFAKDRHTAFSDLFTICGGGTVGMVEDGAADIDSCPQIAGTRLEIELKDADGTILVGSFLPLSGSGLVFIGTLSPSLIHHLDKLDLSLGDFAPFDVLPDFAMMAQINHAVLVDTQLLNQSLAEARDHAVKAREEIEIVAMRDNLTGLGNRTAFQRKIDEEDETARRADDYQAHMLLLDINRFKPINDHFGHHVGDQLLSQMGQKISNFTHDGEQSFRLGGDEFAILYHGIDRHSALSNAGRLIAALSDTYVTDQAAVPVSVSGGFASLPMDAADITGLYRTADVALYSAKEGVDGSLVCVSRRLMQGALERDRLETELGNAIERGQFRNAYQLQYDIKTGLPVGAEALARWDNPRRRGLVPPSEFIPIAEKSALVPSIDLHVLEVALTQMGLWREQGIVLPISVNLSPVTLEQPDLSKRIEMLLQKYKFAASSIEFEITENALIRHSGALQSNLQDIKRQGFDIAIDDFGAGQTSLSHLANLPISRLKIDRSLIAGIETCERRQHIVDALINLARKLGLHITVEGIETKHQAQIIGEFGEVVAQGFYFSRPEFEIDPGDLQHLRSWRSPLSGLGANEKIAS